MRPKGIATFLVLAFGIAWTLWIIPVVLRVSVQSGAFRFAVFVGAFAPAIACFIVRKWVTGEGFADAGLRFDSRKWPYYALALLVPFAVAMGVVLIAPAIGVGEPGPARAVASLVPAAFHSRNTPLTWIAIVLALAVSSVVLTLVLWGEEFGWRGYLQLRLFPQHPLLAAMATGVIWGIWH